MLQDGPTNDLKTDTPATSLSEKGHGKAVGKKGTKGKKGHAEVTPSSASPPESCLNQVLLLGV